MDRKKKIVGVLFFIVVGLGSVALFTLFKSRSLSLDSRASVEIDWNKLYPWREQLDTSSLPGSGVIQSLNELSREKVLYRTLFRANKMYTQTVSVVSGVPQWNKASVWSEVENINSLPGVGNFQSLSEYFLGNTLVRTLFRNNHLYSQIVPDGDWSRAGSWIETVNTNSLPGDGEIQSLSEFEVNGNLVRHLFRADRLFSQVVPIRNNVLLWGEAGSWKETVNTNSLPGDGELQSLTERIQGDFLQRLLIRGNRMFTQSVPTLRGYPNWKSVFPWKETKDLSSLPGSGTINAFSEYILGSGLVRTMFREGRMFSQTVPTVPGGVDWSRAGSWKETKDLSSLPGSGTINAFSESILNNVLYRVMFRGGAMYSQSVQIKNGVVVWNTSKSWEKQNDLSTLPGTGTFNVMSEYVYENKLVRTLFRGSGMYTQAIPLTIW